MPLVILICLLSGTVLTVSGERDSHRKEMRKHARHLFLEGVKYDAEGKMGEAYEYYKRAFQVDSTYPDAGYAYGMLRLSLPYETGDDISPLKALGYVSKLVQEYPGDFFCNTSYAYMAGMLDTLSETIRIFENLDSLYPNKTATLLNLSEAYMSIGDTKKSLDALDRYERIEGMSPALTLRKITYRLHDRDTTGVLGEVDRLLESNPKNAGYVLMKGKVFDVLNQPDSAFRYYKEAEKLDTLSGEIKQTLARAYLNQGDSVSYDNKMIESLLSDDLELEAKLQLTATYLQKIITDKSDIKRGDRIFGALLEQYPHESAILSLSARYNAAKGDFDKSIEDISYAIDLDSQNEGLWRDKMLYQMNAKDYKGAMATFKNGESILEEPMGEGTMILYASAAQEGGDTDEALATYTKLIQGIVPSFSLNDSIVDKTPLRPLDYNSLNRLSVFFQMAADAMYAANPKRMKDAYRNYENALFINPENDLALNNYAYFLIEEEKALPGTELFEKSKRMSRKSLDIDDQSLTYLDTYAWILFKEGNYEEALDYQKAAMEKMEEDGVPNEEFYSHFGDILFKCGDVDGAVSNWEKALELDPENKILKKKISQRQYFE